MQYFFIFELLNVSLSYGKTSVSKKSTLDIQYHNFGCYRQQLVQKSEILVFHILILVGPQNQSTNIKFLISTIWNSITNFIILKKLYFLKNQILLFFLIFFIFFSFPPKLNQISIVIVIAHKYYDTSGDYMIDDYV